jgi:hypothetical protein
MVGLLLLSLAIADQGPSVAPPLTPPLTPMLEVLVKRESGGWAGDSGDASFESYITVHNGVGSCGLGASNKLPADSDRMVWHVTGETLRRNGDALTARVTWHLVRQNGKSVANDTPEHSQQITLRAGEQFVLEPVVTPAGECGATRLEAGVVMRQPRPVQPAGGGGGGTQTRLSSSELLRLRKEAQSVASPAPLSQVAGPPVDLELWLIDKRADGSEHAVRQFVRAGGDNNGAFRFTSVVDDRANGRATVEITGDIQSVRGETPNILRVKVDRRVSSAATGGAAGMSMVRVALASANDVVAIELPERGRAGVRQVVPGHDFSLRVRLAPK